MGLHIDCIPFSFPGLPKIRAVFTTRRGGLSRGPYSGANLSWEVGDARNDVLDNRNALQELAGFRHWAEARQVHGVEVLVEPNPMSSDQCAEIQADGLATSRPDLALVIKTADCQPILLAHNGGRHIAALHCGWRGNRQDFPQIGVRTFCDTYGFPPHEVLAVRGPSLGPGASEFVNFDLEWGETYRKFYDPQSRNVDLWRLTKEQLLQAGLLEERIFSIDLCTSSLPETFFSYRRDKTTGRQAGLIWMDSAADSD
ncbi:polyphenol oxidase family protein [Desulfonatronum parangueonense]